MNETKKPRSAPHRWSRFIYLQPNEAFFLGVQIFRKTGFCGCAGSDGSLCLINPLRKVRTMKHVSNKAPTPSEQGEHGASPRTASHEVQP